MSELTRLQSVAEIDPLLERSREVPVLIFKHSLTCPISRRAYGEYQRYLDQRPEGDPTVCTLVEIQNARDVSATLARRTGVLHESPQALLLRDGEVVWHASHGSIRAEALKRAIVD
ncbi:MAG: bacillithiol system redox-active protein YtxJ [bacterium]|nr:bacillithiol system redox-active protein YtxJ [bacterium]